MNNEINKTKILEDVISIDSDKINFLVTIQRVQKLLKTAGF